VIEQRALVVEHRFTTTFHGMSVRWWIESDADYGGVDAQTASDMISDALSACQARRPEAIARELLEWVPPANSVEVTLSGEGVAVHRNWP